MYRVKWDWGAWKAGDIIELTPEQARWYQADSSGVLEPYTEPGIEPVQRAIVAPPADRQLKQPGQAREEQITRKVYKAVRNK